jgi:hypothetical protein
MTEFTEEQKAIIHAAAVHMMEKRLLDSTVEEWVAEAEADYERTLALLEQLQAMSTIKLVTLDFVVNGYDHGLERLGV